MNLVNKAIKLSKEVLSPPRAEHAHRVALLLYNASQEELAAVYLHDVLEDTSTSESFLAEKFGKKVASIVKEVTNPSSVYNDSGIRDFGHLKDASLEAKRVKLADRIDNIKKRIYGKYAGGLIYANETERLLEIIKDGDIDLANILKDLIAKLRVKALNSRHEDFF